MQLEGGRKYIEFPELFCSQNLLGTDFYFILLVRMTIHILPKKKKFSVEHWEILVRGSGSYRFWYHFICCEDETVP